MEIFPESGSLHRARRASLHNSGATPASRPSSQCKGNRRTTSSTSPRRGSGPSAHSAAIATAVLSRTRCCARTLLCALLAVGLSWTPLSGSTVCLPSTRVLRCVSGSRRSSRRAMGSRTGRFAIRPANRIFMTPMDSRCCLSRHPPSRSRPPRGYENLMKHAQPRDLSRRRVAQLLSETKHDRSVGSRIDVLSRHFVGHPYKPNPLIGSAGTVEVFTASLDGFDCVTYIETIVALARASNVDDFAERLRKIRYERGRIQWKRRNHYMTLWIRNNVREGIIRPVSVPTVPTVSRERILNAVPGLAAQRTRVKCVPRPGLPRLEPHLQSGDLIFFVSTRRNLDVFHAGIIVRDGRKVFMRHASRSHGFVVEQKLSEFLKANRMAGVIVMRPQRAVRRIAAGS